LKKGKRRRKEEKEMRMLKKMKITKNRK